MQRSSATTGNRPTSDGVASALEIEDLTVRFGGVVALDGVHARVAEGEICGLIGPNGAGKTTLFNAITRLVPVRTGTVTVGGAVDVLALRPDQVVRHGIARTFQNVALIDALTVRENVKLGAPEQRGAGVLAALIRRPRTGEAALDARVDEVLERLGILDVAAEGPGELPFGTLKRVELARALLARPRVLLLDEPANGLASGEVEALGDILLDLRDTDGLTIVLVEHHMGLVQRIADHAVVLDFGRVIADGTPAWACAQPGVIDAYLGSGA